MGTIGPRVPRVRDGKLLPGAVRSTQASGASTVVVRQAASRDHLSHSQQRQGDGLMRWTPSTSDPHSVVTLLAHGTGESGGW